MNLHGLNIDTLKPRDEVERNILERIGRWTALLLRHRQRTAELITSGEIIAHDKLIVGNAMGERLEKLRKEQGLTQEQLEKKSGLSQTKISRIEAGAKIMSTEDARQLAPTLKVSIRFLITGK